jgi:hypothetical protein
MDPDKETDTERDTDKGTDMATDFGIRILLLEIYIAL